MRISTRFNAGEIKQLEALNGRIRSGKASRRSLFLADRDFHARLLGKCPNASLLDMIQTLKSEIERWDGGKLRGMANPDKAQSEHAEIIEHLRAGNNEDAAVAIEKHWHEGIKTVSSWIDQQVGEDGFDEQDQTA